MQEDLQKDLRNNIEVDQNIYFYYGILQPDIPNAAEKLAMNLIKKFPKPTKGYTLVYVNNFEKANSSQALADFKKMLSILPLEYFVKLRKMIIMKSTFFQKAAELLSFGVIQKHLKDKTYYIGTLQ